VTSTWHIGEYAIEADWLEAWATVVGAFGALGAFTWQARALAHERQIRREEVQRLEQEQEEYRAARARSIVLGHPYIASDDTGTSSASDVGGKVVLQVELSNCGDTPIYNAIASVHFNNGSSWRYKTGERVYVTKVLFGGDSVLMEWDITETFPKAVFPEGKSREELSQHFTTSASFRDVNGRKWRLDKDGELHKA
jgi:hypothetical protein